MKKRIDFSCFQGCGWSVARKLGFLRPQKAGTRQVRYEDISLTVSPMTSGFARRLEIYKTEAIDLFLKALTQKPHLSARDDFHFCEFGAASGLVSLFVKSILDQNMIPSRVTAIEPALESANEIRRYALQNNLQVRILPMAVSSVPWIKVSQEASKGLVGEALKIKTSHSLTFEAPAIQGRILRHYLCNLTVIYVDALGNEGKILEEVLAEFPEIEAVIIEFDDYPQTDTMASKKLLADAGFDFFDSIRYHYLYLRDV